MAQDNFERMIKLAEEFFETKNDPLQISVTPEVISRLKKIHPATLTEETDIDGPIAWMLVIPTTANIMYDFIAKRINERELLEAIPIPGIYDALYLCSALVLPEYRCKGLAKRLVAQAVKSISGQHPIKFLFYWEFSVEGEKLAAAIARKFSLPLLQRPS